jgi:WD40 repeat protein
MEHRDLVERVVFSPDGSRLVTATSNEYTARVWDSWTGEPVTPPLKHDGMVRDAAFSPDGTRVVTASMDGTARVWDAASGKPLAAPLVHSGWVLRASFAPDAVRVVTASSDGAAYVWMLPLDAQPLSAWKALARCCPFAMNDRRIIGPNPDEPSRCQVR